MFGKTVGCEAGGGVKPGLAAGDHIQHAAGRDCAQHLRDDIGYKIFDGEATADP